MKLEEISPFVRFARQFTLQEDSAGAYQSVQTKDNRLFYITGGQGRFKIDGQDYPVHPQSLLLVRAGQRYCIEPMDHLRLIVLNFDFTDHFSSMRKSFHPFSSGFPGTLEEVHFTDCDLLDTHVVLTNACRLEDRLRVLLNTFPAKGAWRDALLSATMKSVLIDVVQELVDAPKPSGEQSRLVREVVRYLRENYTEPLDGKTLSAVFHFTSVYINRIFKQETGVSVHQYLIGLRIDVAQKLLAAGECAPGEAAALVGFVDYPHFSKTFKRITGLTPMQYSNSSSKQIF